MFHLIVGFLLALLIADAVGKHRWGRRSSLIEQPILGGLVAGGAAALLLHLSFIASALTAAGLLYLIRRADGHRPRHRRDARRARRSALDRPEAAPAAPPPPEPLRLEDGGQLKDSWRRLRRLAPDAPNRIAAIERSCERFLKRAPAGTLDLSTIEDAQLVRDRLPSLIAACEERIEAGGDRATLTTQLLDSLEGIAAAAERAVARLDLSGHEAWTREREHVARRTARDESAF